jgi:uncharacterized protein YcfJ
MKLFTILATTATLVATPVLAEQVNATIEDHYRTVTKQIPQTEQVCNIVDVPIYGQERFDQNGAIVGGIIGGVIGNQIGKGSGNDVATGVGAISGAIIGGKKDGGVVGYRQEERCQLRTTYTAVTEQVYSHSTITWKQNGRRTSVKFYR